MTTTLILILAALICLGLSACVRPHPVQPVQGRLVWLDGCTPRGDQIRLDEDDLVVWACPDGLRLTVRETGEVVEFVSWQEIHR
jgi:hypothetical protein